MKASAFDYVRPASVQEALELLGRHGDTAKLIAGGQSLVPALNLRLLAPGILIDLGGIRDLRGISAEGSTVRIGAMTRHGDLLASSTISEKLPLVAAAMPHIAHPAIRNRGTIGGNLAHADPASELPAVMQAIDAVIVVRDASGERRIAARDFFVGIYETALREDEMIVAVEAPASTPGERIFFHEFSRRSGDYAVAGLAARSKGSGSSLSDLRLAYFSVGEKATLAEKAAAILTGGRIDADRLAAARAALAEDLSPQDDQQASAATRLHLSRVVLARALAALTGDASLAGRASA
jgi:carbon-monoxide dehydrogenase medium subunit